MLGIGIFFAITALAALAAMWIAAVRAPSGFETRDGLHIVTPDEGEDHR